MLIHRKMQVRAGAEAGTSCIADTFAGSYIVTGFGPNHAQVGIQGSVPCMVGEITTFRSCSQHRTSACPNGTGASAGSTAGRETFRVSWEGTFLQETGLPPLSSKSRQAAAL